MWLVPGIDVARYHTGYTVTITKPDGTTDTVGPLNSYKGDGTSYFTYTADQNGTWKFQFSFPGDYYPAGKYTQDAGAVMLFGAGTSNASFPLSMYYTPSTSPVTSITVQQNQVMSYPPSALPTAGDYWTRPIQPDNREWWTIAGNYPGTGLLGGGAYWPADTNPYVKGSYSFVPYVQGPTSAHIVWRTGVLDAGLIGGTTGQSSIFNTPFGTTTTVSIGGVPLVIYNGRGYQAVTVGTNQYLQCYNLRTGQVYWQIPNPFPYTSMASLFGASFADYVAPTVYIYYNTGGAEVPGGSATSEESGNYLVSFVSGSTGSQLIELNPMTGAVAFSTTLPSSIRSTTLYATPLALSVQAINGGSSYRLINWSIAGFDTNFADRIISNITWPLSSLPTYVDYNAMVGVSTTRHKPKLRNIQFLRDYSDCI